MKRKGLKAIIANVLAITVSATMLVGSTFAYFTDSTVSSENVIASGNLSLNAYWMEGTKDPDNDTWVEFNDGAIFNYSMWEPGYVEAKHLMIENAGNLAFKYKMLIVPNGEVSALADVIDVYYYAEATTLSNRDDLANGIKVGTLSELISDEDGVAYGALLPSGAEIKNAQIEKVEKVSITIALKMREDAGTSYQGLSIGTNFDINIYATQYAYESDSFGNDYDINAEFSIPDRWDGTVDYSWYDREATELSVTSAEAFAGLATLVDGIDYNEANRLGFVDVNTLEEGATIPDSWNATFEGQTIKLETDIDLFVPGNDGEPVSFNPIGSYAYENAFMGVFDGQGHTISNLYQSGWALGNGVWDGDDCGLGLFGLIENASIKNLTIDGASIPTEANLIGSIAGVAMGDCTFENITVSDTYLGNHSWYSGGLVGWSSGNQKFIDCNVTESTVVSSQWGDFNNANGGLIGGIDNEGTYYFENCNVACVIDAYNDVTSAYEWYSYRNVGMLIGDTGSTIEIDGTTYASAPNVTCVNCTVTYGEWANYHYCEFSSSSYPWCRVEKGESTGAYGNARVGEYYDANGNKVIDDNHAHNEGEAHNELIVFDQLFGGPSGDRYVTYGTATHEGVTVIYNNK